jgi:hypothetical protein
MLHFYSHNFTTYEFYIYKYNNDNYCHDVFLDNYPNLCTRKQGILNFEARLQGYLHNILLLKYYKPQIDPI